MDVSFGLAWVALIEGTTGHDLSDEDERWVADYVSELTSRACKQYEQIYTGLGLSMETMGKREYREDYKLAEEMALTLCLDLYNEFTSELSTGIAQGASERFVSFLDLVVPP